MVRIDMVPGRHLRVEDPNGWLRIDVGLGQKPMLFPWAHVGLASLLSLLAEGQLIAWDASDAIGHVS